MPDAFDVLCDRVRTLREGWGEIERASLVFVAGIGIGEPGMHRVRVRVDGRPAAVVGSKGLSVSVEPGARRIRVRFSRWTGLKIEKTETILRSVEVGPGDRVVLVCGMDREAGRAWADYEAHHKRRLHLWLLSSMAATAAGFLLFPMLRGAVATLVTRLNFDGRAMRLAYLSVRSRGHAAGFATLGPHLWMVSSSFRFRRALVELRSRHPSPFFVGPKDKRPLADDEFGS